MSPCQELNFEGGPWLLRNGEKVEKLIRTDKNEYLSKEDKWKDVYWDNNGNGWIDGGPVGIDVYYNFDIVESCYNWKYLREHGLEE